MPQGRRAAFDKKTHRRIWVRTNRLTYIYNAAHLIEDRDPQEIAEDVLTHLEEVQDAIRTEVGKAELNNLADSRPIDLEEDIQINLKKAIGDKEYNSIASLSFQAIPREIRLDIIQELGRQFLTKVYRQLLLSVISNLWVEYLTQVEALRVSIGLEAYAQRDPLVQYKNKAFEMFQNLLKDMRMSVVTRMFTFRTRDVSTIQASTSREVPSTTDTEKREIKSQQKPKKKRRRRQKR